MEKKVYRSRISLLYVPVILCLVWFTSNTSGYFVGFIVLVVISVFYILAFRSIKYVLTDKEIHIYYLWGIRGRIFISAIASVERSHNPFYAFASSPKRLRFNFKRGYKWHVHFSNSPFFIAVFPSISPAHEQEFLDTLKTLNPNIQINVTDKKGWWWRFWGWDI